MIKAMASKYSPCYDARMVSQRKLTPFFSLIGNLTTLFSAFLCVFFISSSHTLAGEKKSKVSPPYTVVIDPGHGGEDEGATAWLNKKGKKVQIKEKDIVLAIAIRLEKVLLDPNYWKPLGRPIKVIFTRRSDKTITLAERAKMSQNIKADLYLSIHANAEPTRKASGIETYFLKNDEASSQKLASIQEKGQLKDHGYAKDTSDQDLALLISNVAADATVDASKQAAELIHKSLVGTLARREALKANRGVKQALLFVLLNAQTPAVLLESFYLSHPKDLAYVSEPENRQKIAEGIAMGILRFLALR